MEMLVTLMLVSFATMLMFQMLGSYRIANERVSAQAGLIDRQALLYDWFRDTVHGLFTARDLIFTGDPERFMAVTINPLYAPEGSPTRIGWSLQMATNGRQEIVYSESGRERWRLPLDGDGSARFVYLDESGRQSSTWPPKLGLVKPEKLPAVVMLSRGENSGLSPALAAVLGPLEPPYRLYGLEQMD
ncbi:hypothetical protein [Thermomonas carbonis]|uniref:hypothetical protein n=1 Tax=Thermomonas carbonis TaxID=1463158 RepID=UPI001679B1C0|nr:hypothetical protein [Thermomonas carbonis]